MLKAFDHQYFKALLILMPGFITQRVYAYFATSSKLSEFELVASALAFSIVNFSLALGAWWLMRGRAEVERVSGEFVTLLLVISIALGGLWAAVDASGTTYKWLPITQRVSNTSPWSTAFRENKANWKALVRVEVKEGRVYHGWPRFFSEDADGKNQLHLKPAFIEQGDGSCPPLEGPGVFLFEENIRAIEFLTVADPNTYECPRRPQAVAEKKPCAKRAGR